MDTHDAAMTVRELQQKSLQCTLLSWLKSWSGTPFRFLSPCWLTSGLVVGVLEGGGLVGQTKRLTRIILANIRQMIQTVARVDGRLAVNDIK